jgi:DNA-directed RNA polymerase specialized sigma24 family protein
MLNKRFVNEKDIKEHHSAKLNHEQRMDIVKRYWEGEKRWKLAHEYKVSISTIHYTIDKYRKDLKKQYPQF